MKISINIYMNLFWIFDKLSHLNSPHLAEFLKLLLRNAYTGTYSTSKIEYLSKLLGFLKHKLTFITNSKQNLSSLVFIKILRLVILIYNIV